MGTSQRKPQIRGASCVVSLLDYVLPLHTTAASALWTFVRAMRVCTLVVAALAIGQSVRSALFAPEGPVVVADISTFDDQVLALTKPTFVAFTTPWCHHCAALAPEYEGMCNVLFLCVVFVIDP